MYLNYYQLKQNPFTICCDEQFFYESPVHAEALANMMYTVQGRKGMVLVTGEVGAGKTFVGNVLSARLGSECTCILLRNPPANGKQLLRALCDNVGLNLPAAVDKLRLLAKLEEHMIRLNARGRLVALILDEAQELPPATLTELRLLWNWEWQGQRLIQIVLIGQPELRDVLGEPCWEPLRQRIVLSYHLGNLPADEVGKYIRHRIAVASVSQAAVEFDDAAVAEIRAATGGIPRMINVLCDNTLLIGYAREVRRIDGELVREVLRDLTCWNMKRPVRVAAPQVDEYGWSPPADSSAALAAPSAVVTDSAQGGI